MRKSKYNLEREANLSFIEIEELAEEVRKTLFGNNAYTIREYIRLASAFDSGIIGYRKGRALIFEPKLESYFPDKVFAALKKRAREEHHHRFNKDDDAFIEKHLALGISWLAERFYTEPLVIYKRIDEIGLRDKLPIEECSVFNAYEQEPESV